MTGLRSNRVIAMCMPIKIRRAWLALALLSALACWMPVAAQTPTVTTLYNFDAPGTYQESIHVIQASDGNLYGTERNTVSEVYGAVFKLTTSGAFTLLYSFTGGSDGAGTVFKITTAGALATLHSFFDGWWPFAPLVQASDGNLYGTTLFGGTGDPLRNGLGTVFKITPSGDLTILHSFQRGSGSRPFAGLLLAADGNLYGTAGSIFRITPSGAFKLLCGISGQTDDRLIEATDGTLYGVTDDLDANGGGALYRVSGIYPVPVVTSLSPSTANANGPAVTLKLTGSAFQKFSHANWNGIPLATTYISPTHLRAAVPASLIATAGMATVTVVTGAGGGTSNAETFTLFATTLKLKTAKLRRNVSKNTLTCVVTLSNAGFLAATNTTVTSATLNASAATNLPQSAGSIAAGSTSTATLTIPGSAGSSGQTVILKVSGTFAGGKFNGSLKVKLP